MPTPVSLARLRALEVLADGEWHDYRVTIKDIAAAVPPGVAMRRAEAQRIRSIGSDAPRKYRAGKDSRLIEIGATSIAREVVADATTFEIDPRGTPSRVGPKKIRLVAAKVPPKGVPDGQ